MIYRKFYNCSCRIPKKCFGILQLQLFYTKDRTYFPNTVYFMSRWGCLAYVMKNWEPFVLGPLFAIETTPLTLCWMKDQRIITLLMCTSNFETYTKLMLTFRCSLNSSSNLRPHILVPPLPEPEQVIKTKHNKSIYFLINILFQKMLSALTVSYL